MAHLIFNAKTEAKQLMDVGITNAQVGKELDYRDNAQISSPEPDSLTCGWGDDLCMYSTAELEEIEAVWNSV